MKPRILIKIGGRAFDSESAFRALADAIKAHRPIDVIIVHGGGNEISRALKKANRETVFVDGIRVTPAGDMRIVEEILSKKINKRIASLLDESGIPCKRMSGKTEGLFLVSPLIRQGQSLGYVGKIEQVHAKPVLDGLRSGQVPVVSPVSADENGNSYNVNADSAAAALAVASKCSDLVYLTDVPGVRVGHAIRPILTLEDARMFIADGTIQGGMVAKMESSFEALKGHVERVHITQWHGKSTLHDIVQRKPVAGTIIQLWTERDVGDD